MSSDLENRIRYAQSIDTVVTDGRGVNTAIGTLAGEAAQQEAMRSDMRLATWAPEPWSRVPSVTASDTTYYDRPLLKPSVWGIDIPLYYFLGGAAGAALSLGAAVQLIVPREDGDLRRFSAICHWIGIIGSTAGAALLIHDLGRPSRFLFMLRVFRPTSPMNMGSWILSAAAPSAIATGLLLNREGILGTIGEISGYISGLFGAALATYTGVLASNTAIPIWQESRRWMPFLFASSGAATAGSLLEMLYTGSEGRWIARIFGTVGRATEIVAARQVEHAASRIPKVGEPMHHGRPALLWKTAAVLTVASLTVSLIPAKSRRKTFAAGLLGIAGSLCMRFAVHYIGNASARDPRAVFAHQRGAGA